MEYLLNIKFNKINFIFINVLELNEPRLEALAQTYLERQDGVNRCSLCGQAGKDRYAMKMHLESKHFPTEGGYACDMCDKLFNTKNAYKTHKSNSHMRL